MKYPAKDLLKLSFIVQKSCALCEYFFKKYKIASVFGTPIL
jgi:hypothetical protein